MPLLAPVLDSLPGPRHGASSTPGSGKRGKAQRSGRDGRLSGVKRRRLGSPEPVRDFMLTYPDANRVAWDLKHILE